MNASAKELKEAGTLLKEAASSMKNSQSGGFFNTVSGVWEQLTGEGGAPGGEGM
jgi:hypothetical protein